MGSLKRLDVGDSVREYATQGSLHFLSCLQRSGCISNQIRIFAKRVGLGYKMHAQSPKSNFGHGDLGS